MSVIFFGVAELANATAYLARQRWEQPEDMHEVARDFAAYSVGNAAAFAYRYSERGVKPHAAADILSDALKLRASDQVNADNARGTLRLLRYNGPEGEGLTRFKGSQAYGAAVSNLLQRAYSRVLEELESKTRPIDTSNVD